MSSTIKNVDRKQCIGSLIFSIFALATVFIPFILRNTTFAFQSLPLIGDGSFIDSLLTNIESAFKLIQQQAFFTDNKNLIETICLISFYAFYGIVLFDFIFSLILLIFPCEVLRLIVKIFSIIFGVVMILLTIVYVLFIIGFIAHLTTAIAAGESFKTLVQTCGALYMLVMVIFCFLLMSKQFKWFRKYY